MTLSNNATLREISEMLKEPEWLLSWRKLRQAEALTLPHSIKHGISVSALFPETEPDFTDKVVYNVDATKGLEIYTWSEAVNQEEVVPIVKGLLESDFFPHAKDYFRAQALSQFSSGLVVYVQPTLKEDGTFVEEKLTLDTKVGGSASADVIIVIVKSGARFDLTTTTHGGGMGSVHSRTLVVVSEQDTVVRITEHAPITPSAMLMRTSRAIVSGNASVTWRELYMYDILISSITDSLLIGASARTEILQGVIGASHAEFDMDASARHIADDTHSRIRTAGIGLDSTRILYRGLIDMKEGVHKAVGAQEANFLALSKDATIDAIPSLDIASNDVVCSHKLSVTHLSDGDMFYPKLRGLSDTESRNLFIEAYFANVFTGDEHSALCNTLRDTLLQHHA